MADKLSPRNFAARLRATLDEGLETAGIQAKVEIEKVRGTRLHRVTITSPQFESLQPSERQDLVWRIVDQRFKPEEQLHISIIYTATPEEIGV